MSFCLPKEFANKFIDALKSGKIKPEELIDMTSAERRSFLEPIVGKENVKEVNALLESKLLLKDQKKGLVTWAKKVSGISEPVRQDIISKIERMEKVLDAADEAVFLEDLAAKRLGADVTFEEATKIVEGARAVEEAKLAIPEKSPNGSDARIDYGVKFTAFQKYVADLKVRAETPTWKEWITSPGEMFMTVAGTTKSILSSMDNSFFGRQGIKLLYTHPDIWARNFSKSWGDIGKEAFGIDKTKSVKENLFKGIDALDPIKADIYSRENALNGKYQSMGLDIGLFREEAFPSSLPERIPGLSRLYNASQSAFTGGALRMRADYADRLIKKAEEFGVDMLNPGQAEGIGSLVNSMTGRGKVKLTPGQSDFVNATIFSIRFLKSNIDTLTAHRLGYAIEKGPARDFARREAAKNVLKITATVAGVLYAANTLWPGSVEFDPHSSNFGKIRIGKHTFDITGGMGSLVTLASRITPTKRGDKGGLFGGGWSFWYKSKTGKWTDLSEGNYGQQNALDVLESFAEGKLSPIAAVLRDIWVGENFDGDKPTPTSIVTGLVTPIPVQNALDLNEPNSVLAIGLMILDGLGLSVNTDIKR